MKRIKRYLIDAQTLIEGLESPDESSKGEELDTLWTLVEAKRIEVLIRAEEWETLKQYLYKKVSSRKRAEAIIQNISKTIKVSSRDKDKGLQLIALSRIGRDRDRDYASVEAILIQHSSISREPSALVLESFLAIATLWITKAIAEMKSESEDFISDRINTLLDIKKSSSSNFQAFINQALHHWTEASSDDVRLRLAASKELLESEISDRNGDEGAPVALTILENWNTLISAINSPGERPAVIYENVEFGDRRLSPSEIQKIGLASFLSPNHRAFTIEEAQPSRAQGVSDAVEATDETGDTIVPNNNVVNEVNDPPPATEIPDDVETVPTPDVTPPSNLTPGLIGIDIPPANLFLGPELFVGPILESVTANTPAPPPVSPDAGLDGFIPADAATAGIAAIQFIDQVEVIEIGEGLLASTPDEATHQGFESDTSDSEPEHSSEDDALNISPGEMSPLVLTEDTILTGGVDAHTALVNTTVSCSDTTEFSISELSALNLQEVGYGVMDFMESALDIGPFSAIELRYSAVWLIAKDLPLIQGVNDIAMSVSL